MRALVKKIKDIATVADRMSLILIVQRRLIDQMNESIASTAAAVQASAVAQRKQGNGAAAPALSGSILPAQAPPSEEEMEAQDAKWLLEIKPLLEEWLADRFVNASCAADVSVSRAEVNMFIRDQTMRRLNVSAQRAVELLQIKWRLPARPLRPAAPTARTTAPPPAVKAKKTPGYRYLHRVCSHFFQRLGN